MTFTLLDSIFVSGRVRKPVRKGKRALKSLDNSRMTDVNTPLSGKISRNSVFQSEKSVYFQSVYPTGHGTVYPRR